MNWLIIVTKNSNKIIYIMNENNFTQDDAITILRIFLFKAKDFYT